MMAEKMVGKEDSWLRRWLAEKMVGREDGWQVGTKACPPTYVLRALLALGGKSALLFWVSTRNAESFTPAPLLIHNCEVDTLI
jgi:hypothetical protein